MRIPALGLKRPEYEFVGAKNYTGTSSEEPRVMGSVGKG